VLARLKRKEKGRKLILQSSWGNLRDFGAAAGKKKKNFNLGNVVRKGARRNKDRVKVKKKKKKKKQQKKNKINPTKEKQTKKRKEKKNPNEGRKEQGA